MGTISACKTRQRLYKLIALFMSVTLCMFSLTACGKKKIPNLYNIDEDKAKSTLFDEGFIVSSKYEYSDTVKKGCVIYSVPAFGESISSGSNIIIYISKGEKLKVPNLTGVDEYSARQTLTENGLIVNVEYEYSNLVDEGTVVSTSPAAGEAYEKNDNITVTVSKGPSSYTSKSSLISWKSISEYGDPDDYEFSNPYVNNGILYIPLEVLYGSYAPKILGFGTASIYSDFVPDIPIDVAYDSEYVSTNEWTNLELQIPVEDLGESRPTKLYVKYYVELFSVQSGYFQKGIELSFNITW